MKNSTGFSVYVSDARKGTTFIRGFKAGWLGANGTDSTWSQATRYESLEAAYQAIEELGALSCTSVIAGKLTAYVSHPPYSARSESP